MLLVRGAAGDEDIPAGATGVVLGHELAHLSHLAVRARQAGVVLAAGEDPALLADLARTEGQWLALVATADGVSWRAQTAPADKSPGESNAARSQTRPARGRDADNPLARRALAVSVGVPPSARPAKAHPLSRRTTIPLAEATLAIAGGKADGLRRLAELSRRPDALFKTPPALVVPFGVLRSALDSWPGVRTEYQDGVATLEQSLAPGQAQEKSEEISARLRELVCRLAVPEQITAAVAATFGPDARLMARSSANCEDLAHLAGAGLYESVANVAVAELGAAIGRVWASLWSRRAALSRAQAGIPADAVEMAVVIQPLIVPEFAFVLHTTNPLDGHRGEVYAEIVAGLGETLVSANARGNPYRLVCPKTSAPVRTLAFANFSGALAPADQGLISRVIDYSQMALSRDASCRDNLGRRLAAIGGTVESALGCPQDIEGVIIGEDIFLVQARPQQGLC